MNLLLQFVSVIQFTLFVANLVLLCFTLFWGKICQPKKPACVK